MKPLILLGAVLTAAIFLTGCDPNRHARTQSTHGAPTDKPKDKVKPPGSATLDPATDGQEEPTGPSTTHEPPVDTNPHPSIPPPPKPEKDEYAKKIPGKAGFVTDPNDPQGRPLDVRGMPPGTKIQSPFSGSVLLVPPQ